MIFAIQTTDPKPTRLRVSGDVGTPAPAMTSLRRGALAPSSVGCVDGSWTMDLDAGDYLIEIQVENWVPGRLDVAIELTPGQSPPTFVDDGPLPQGSSPSGLVAWNATDLFIDPPESSIASDPKDPWPPTRPLRITPIPLTPVSSEWFTGELTAARTRIAGQLAGKSVPASVLEAFLTER